MVNFGGILKLVESLHLLEIALKPLVYDVFWVRSYCLQFRSVQFLLGLWVDRRHFVESPSLSIDFQKDNNVRVARQLLRLLVYFGFESWLHYFHGRAGPLWTYFTCLNLLGAVFNDINLHFFFRSLFLRLLSLWLRWFSLCFSFLHQSQQIFVSSLLVSYLVLQELFVGPNRLASLLLFLDDRLFLCV